jgi:hypothetical protein
MNFKNGDWFRLESDKLIYYFVRDKNTHQPTWIWPRLIEMVVLSEKSSDYSPAMTLLTPEKDMLPYKPTREDRHRVFMAVFGEGWIKSGQ